MEATSFSEQATAARRDYFAGSNSGVGGPPGAGGNLPQRSVIVTGQLTPADASELSKVVACTVKSFEAAEFADSLARIDQLSDAELHRIAAGGSAPQIIGPRLLAIGSR